MKIAPPRRCCRLLASPSRCCAGWYTENYAASIAPALTYHFFISSAGEGRIASAARWDYAEAAAVIACDDQARKVYELAGDDSYMLAEFAAEIARQSGEQVEYVNLSPAEFASPLKGAGLPEGLAEMLADLDKGAAQGGLFDDSHSLSQLIGRATTALAERNQGDAGEISRKREISCSQASAGGRD